MQRVEYDRHSGRAYVEFREPDGDGGDAITVTVLSYRTWDKLTKKQAQEEIVRKARHLLPIPRRRRLYQRLAERKSSSSLANAVSHETLFCRKNEQMWQNRSSSLQMAESRHDARVTKLAL
jgi:hypothetical protein